MHTTKQRRPLRWTAATALAMATGIAPALLSVQVASAAVPDDVYVEVTFDLDGPIRPGDVKDGAGFVVKFFDRASGDEIDQLDAPITIEAEGLFGAGAKWDRQTRDVGEGPEPRLVGISADGAIADAVTFLSEEFTVQASGERFEVPFTAPTGNGYLELATSWGELVSERTQTIQPVQERHRVPFTPAAESLTATIGEAFTVTVDDLNPAADAFLGLEGDAYWHSSRPAEADVASGDLLASGSWKSEGPLVGHASSLTPRPDVALDVQAPTDRGEGVIAVRWDRSSSIAEYIDEADLAQPVFTYIDVEAIDGGIIPTAPARAGLADEILVGASFTNDLATANGGLTGKAYYLEAFASGGAIPADAEELVSKTFAAGEKAELVVPALGNRTGFVVTVWNSEGDLLADETSEPTVTSVLPNKITGTGVVSTELATIGDTITATFNPELTDALGESLTELPVAVQARWTLTVAGEALSTGLVPINGDGPATATIELPTNAPGAATVSWKIDPIDQAPANGSLVEAWSQGSEASTLAIKSLRITGTVSADRVIVDPSDKVGSVFTPTALNAQGDEVTSYPAKAALRVEAVVVPGVLAASDPIPADAEVVAKGSYELEQTSPLVIGDISSGAANGEVSTIAFRWSVDGSNGVAEAWESTGTLTVDARTAAENAEQAIEEAAAEQESTEAAADELVRTGVDGVGIAVLSSLGLLLGGGVLLAVRRRAALREAEVVVED